MRRSAISAQLSSISGRRKRTHLNPMSFRGCLLDSHVVTVSSANRIKTDNMSITKKRSNASPLQSALGSVPLQFRSKIVASYIELRRRYSEGRIDSAGLSAGKFCESILRFLQQYLTGAHTTFGTQIPNFHAECEKLGQTPKTAGPESLRVVVPRALAFLYTLRNKRGIGHVGGDVDANAVDGATHESNFQLDSFCELIQVFHSLSLEDAQALVDSLAARNLPLVWDVGGKKRILASGLDYKQQVLLLLATVTTETAVLTEDLFDWTEYSNLGVFKRAVLSALHKSRLVEYDKTKRVGNSLAQRKQVMWTTNFSRR